MKKSLQRCGAILGLTFLVLTGAAVAHRTEAGETGKEAITLIGRLAEPAEGSFVLVEQESGEEVLLAGSESILAQHVGSTVRVTGRWAKNDEGAEHFAVSRVERFPALS